MGRKRKPEGESDRNSKRIHAAFSPEEFTAIAKYADDEFCTLADAVRDLAMAGLEAATGKAPPLSGLAASKAEERELKNAILEIELLKAQREAIPVAAVHDVIVRDYGVIRSRILSIPHSDMTLNAEQRANLKKAVNDCMLDLSGTKQETWDDIAEEQNA
jgi:hypothetical protein